MFIRKLCLALAVATLSIGTITAQDRSVILTYPAGYRSVDMSIPANVSALNEIAAGIKQAKADKKRFKITCVGYSAPESENTITRNIGKSREEALAEMFAERKLCGEQNVDFIFGGTGWTVLKNQVEWSDLPQREAVLQILSRPDEVVLGDVHDNQALIVEGLKRINKGQVWEEINNTVIPVIRNTLYVTTSSGKKFSLRYQIGFNKINPRYDGNDEKLSEIIDALKDGETVEIAYSPNPGSDNEIYRNIAETRAKNLAELFVQQSKANRSKISYTTTTYGWTDLKGLVAQGNESWRQDALNVINNYREHLTKSSKTANDVKLKLLKDLDNGRVYEKMKLTMFPVINNILVVNLKVEK